MGSKESSPTIGGDVCLNAASHRRSIYGIIANSSVSDARVQEIIRKVQSFAPSAFNSQPIRYTLVTGDKHNQMWDAIIEAAEPILKAAGERICTAMQKSLQGHHAAYGSVVFWESGEAQKGGAEKNKSAAPQFLQYGEHASGMAQLLVWTALELEGLGVNLQHMQSMAPVEAAMKKFCQVPVDYSLKTHLNYGDKEVPSCSACVKAGIDCERALQIRFRPGLGLSAEYTFSSDQTWVRPRKSLEYVDETDRVSQDYEDRGQEDMSLTEDLTVAPDTTELDQHASALAHISPASHGSQSMTSLPGNSPVSTQMTRHLRYSSELVRSPDSPYSRPPMQFTTREAELIKNFTENMALWADATDMNRHFELEVPRRSLYFPVLRYAVFAFSSRHINRDKADTSTEALEYYNSCLSVLIEAVDKASGHIDEETLAAIAILRQYEEMDAEDMEMHLTGTSRIVNSMSEFDFNGGLGEAAAWLCLRQDIYVSLTRLRPLRSNLENYLQSDIFRRTDDAAYANRMVYLLARSLGSIYPSDSSISNESLESIRLDVDGWFDSKPAAFNPILESGRNKDEGKLLPTIWVLSPFHSVGLQYYHIAKIVLAMSLPITTDSVFEQIRESKKVERTIRNHLLQIIALASSHAKAENALFTARHSLSVWGSVFTEKLDQDMVLDFLRHIQQKTGWQTNSLSLSLQQQWTQDTNED
ncbi:putative nitroreductase HBN1 [Fusarium oxysporum f. sp. cubense]|uniref:Putative nitroreductase HBN1 n=1 Tax=Fusarium oxysporum f. sp. cubense TaxID=61366 RepID=A0A559LN50_FUSOC|nr:putative nitroreductase HBN1 [Fusarium oxysporum f. sp. cubense]